MDKSGLRRERAVNGIGGSVTWIGRSRNEIGKRAVLIDKSF